MSPFSKALRKIASVLSVAVIGICFIVSYPVSVSAEEQELDLNAMAEEMTILVNEARAEAGLEPLYIVPYLNDIANVRARECIEAFSHIRPNGESFITILDTSIADYGAAAENIAAGGRTAESTFLQWKNSQFHWENIMNPIYTHIGVGICYEPNSTYKWYWEQFFISNDNFIDGQYLPQKYKIIPACCGDVNGDGGIDVYDYIMLTKCVAKEVTFNPLQITSADCMQDGEITIADAVILRKFILGMYDTLPFVI